MGVGALGLWIIDNPKRLRGMEAKRDDLLHKLVVYVFIP
jgi:hypothetical protein